MYYKYYDPTIHDIYLYGPGNIGMPTGLNPTSLIYGASADFASILPRYRAFTGTGPVPIPPGAGVTSFPNYYNIKDNPLYVIVGNKTLVGNLHYTANKPSDCIDPFGFLPSKYTGTTTGYPALSVTTWNNNLSGFCSYGPFTGMYNCVPLNQITGSTAYAIAQYFLGSPEIPGFAAGSTQYQILTDDCGFFDLIGNGPTFSQPIAKKISASTLIQELIEQGMTADYVIQNGDIDPFYIIIPGINLFMWDGNDKIIPITKIKFEYIFLEELYQFIPINYQAYFDTPLNEVDAYAIWLGDSSSQVLYMKNNSLYFVGGVYSVGTSFGESPQISQGMLYCGENLPLYGFLQNRLVDKNHYSYPFHQGLTLATQSDFNTLQTRLNNFNTSLNSLYEKWTT
jgi:hypothetical protein